MHNLVKNYVVKYFGGIGNAEVPLEAMDDAAVVGDIVLKSDSHAVKPIFFPGGDIACDRHPPDRTSTGESSPGRSTPSSAAAMRAPV